MDLTGIVETLKNNSTFQVTYWDWKKASKAVMNLREHILEN